MDLRRTFIPEIHLTTWRSSLKSRLPAVSPMGSLLAIRSGFVHKAGTEGN